MAGELPTHRDEHFDRIATTKDDAKLKRAYTSFPLEWRAALIEEQLEYEDGCNTKRRATALIGIYTRLFSQFGDPTANMFPGKTQDQYTKDEKKKAEKKLRAKRKVRTSFRSFIQRAHEYSKSRTRSSGYFVAARLLSSPELATSLRGIS
jgi:hypothetical protein